MAAAIAQKIGNTPDYGIELPPPVVDNSLPVDEPVVDNTLPDPQE